MSKFTDAPTLWDQIREVVPGGVDGNAKIFSGPMPVIESARGSRLTSVDGHEYIDFCSGYGPLIFGHCDPDIVRAVKTQLERGLLYGLPHQLMLQAAKKVIDAVPCAEMVRFTNSGTEATLNAIRLARGVTGRDKIVKFYGAYHGTHEFALIGTNLAPTPPDFPRVEPNTAGIPEGVLRDIYVLPFNDGDTAEQFLTQHGEEIAAVIVEPLLGSHGIVAEKPFLQVLRRVTSNMGIVLIFDEVITGFRLHLGGAQALFGVEPDLVTLGKAMGGGFPIAAFAGKQSLMQHITPAAQGAQGGTHVYHSGTYNSNPLALAAVVASVDKLADPSLYERINTYGERLRTEITSLFHEQSVVGTTAGFGSVVQWYLGIEGPLRTLEDTRHANRAAHARMHRELLHNGVFFIPNPRGFVSTAHTESDLERTVTALRKSLETVKDAGLLS